MGNSKSPKKKLLNKDITFLQTSKVQTPKKSDPELNLDKEDLDERNELIKIQIKDYDWKVAARKTYGRILIALLIVQNLAVFTLVFWAFITGKLKDMQIVFSILIPATLGETAYMVKTIVEWLFKDINYPE